MKKQEQPRAGGQMRITNEDLQMLKSMFADNDQALMLLRKIFLPELSPDVALGQQIDLWMTVPVDNMHPDEALVNLKARNLLINHLEQRLLQLKQLAGRKDETVEETKRRLEQNSNK